MSRLLVLGLVPCLLIVPHLVPLPDRPVEGIGDAPPLRDVKDDGRKLPTNERMEQLAKTDSIAFLENCIRRYNRDIETGFSCTLQKQERIRGKLEKKEIVEVYFKNKPHSVFMNWKEGERLVKRVVYVEGENDDKALIKPAGLGSFLVVSRDPEGEDARKSARYTLKEFGLKKGAQRTLASWEEARKEDALHVEYQGTRKIKEAGDRECFILKRTKFKRPEMDGILEVTIFVDTENWLQVGSILKGEGGKLVAEYWFREVRLDPKFDADQFTKKALTK